MKRDELHRIVRNCLNSHYYGSLATVDSEGYAYGSLVRYCLDNTGQPLFCLSGIAEHTTNFVRNPQVSLFILNDDEDNIQESTRLTVFGEMVALKAGEDQRAQFFRFYPETEQYFQELDFEFYRLNIHKARYVGGFAKAHWLKDASFTQKNPLSAKDQTGILGHMNEDHLDATAKYCQLENIDIKADVPLLAGIDQEGCHIRLGNRICRIPFSRPVQDKTEARNVLVEMAQS